ncbi:MAG TPA: DUF1844 domain-containing protein [Blastocatellia bacterium]|nr:DUF1844 domain-containing protein [Blastocatellia bacterium]
MADEKEIGFKVTDRRKFNPDGSLRDYVEEPPAQPAATAGQQRPQEAPAGAGGQAAADNVVSFSRKKEQPERSERVGPAPNEAAVQAATAYQQESSARRTTRHQASLLGLVNMLASEAAMFLGLIENPVNGEVSIDLDSAREVIDLLGVLEQKTRGNLTTEEDRTMEDVLAYLRMQYVMAAKKR